MFVHYKQLAGIMVDRATQLLGSLSTESKSDRMKNLKRLVVKQKNMRQDPGQTLLYLLAQQLTAKF